MTDCLDPIAPTDEELMDYALDGEPISDEAKNHLNTCPICKQRVTLYTRANKFFTSHLYRSQCPPATQLAEYCVPISLRLLANEERIYITEHARICPLCSTEIAHIHRDLAFDHFPKTEGGIKNSAIEY